MAEVGSERDRSGEPETFVAVHVTSRTRPNRLVKAAGISFAGVAVAFVALSLLSKGPANESEHKREVSLAVEELAGGLGDPDLSASFSEPSIGIFTGHTKGRKGTPLTFGKKTYYNVFDPNPYQEECYPGMYGRGGEACRECPAGAWCPGGREAVLCPDHATSLPGSYHKASCACRPGYYGGADGCKECPANSYCPGGTAVHACPPFSSSNTGSFQCRCARGYFGETADKCVICPAGSYCNGHQHKAACPSHTESPAGSFDASACRCVPSYFELQAPSKGAAAQCGPCAADKYCPGGKLAVPCPSHSTSPVESSRVEHCTCRPGYYGEEAKACKRCPKGFYCPGGSDAQACPKNSHSDPAALALSDCRCVPGYVGDGPTSCGPCPAGSFCTGGNSVKRCPANSGSDEGASACACSKGFRGSDALRCQVCPAMSYCPGEGRQKTCPRNTQSAQGKARQRQCLCDRGYYGTGGTDCSKCPANKFCPSVGGAPRDCPRYAESGAGTVRAAECRCGKGYYNRRSSARMGHLTGPDCATCRAGRFCPGGGKSVRCPARTTSRPGATSVLQCQCAPGHYGKAPNCKQCPVGSYCPGGEEARACPARTTGPRRARSVSQCVCQRGFFGTDPNRCARCPRNSYCPGGARVRACPARSESDEGQHQCKCVAGYYGSNARHCRPCPRNRYCPGGSAVRSCPRFSRARSRAKSPKDCQCVARYYAYESAGKATCRACPEGSFCPGKGRRRSCPNLKTSNRRARSPTNCGCIAGYYDGGLVPHSNFAWEYRGQLGVRRGGRYLMCITSDDGSRLFVNGRYTVNNDGLHGTRRRCGWVTLRRGRADIKVDGFQAGGAVSMWLKYRGPDTRNKMRFMRSVEKDGSGRAGWNLKLYRSRRFLPRMPDVRKLSFLGETSVPSVHVPVARGAGRFRHYLSSKCRKCRRGSYCPGAFPTRRWWPRAHLRRCPGRRWTAEAGARASKQCTACRPGYYGEDYRSCRGCPRGHYCPGGKEKKKCPAGSTTYHAHRSSIAHCVCNRGFQRKAGGRRYQCQKCSAGYYCPHYNGRHRRRCPYGSTSPTGSRNVRSCQCGAGKYGGRGHRCYTCQARYYCPGNGRRYYCHHGARSPRGAGSKSSCFCPKLSEQFPVIRKGQQPACKRYHCRTISKCTLQRWCQRDRWCRGFTFPRGKLRGFGCKLRGLSACLDDRKPAPLDFHEKKRARQPKDSVSLMRRLRLTVPVCRPKGKPVVAFQHCWPHRTNNRRWQATLYEGTYPHARRGHSCPNDKHLCMVKPCGLRGGDMSSIDIPAGYKVEVYSSTNFRGQKMTLTGPMKADDNCFTKFSLNGRRSWNDRVRSVKVMKA